MRLIRTANAEELDAMRVAYVDVMGEEFDGGALTEEDFWNLVRLGDNVFARRRIADHHLAEGDVFEAGSELLCAAERGDRESIRRLVTGREFVSHVDTSLNVAALLNLVFLDDSGLAEFVEGLGREDPVAADNILMWSWTWNRDPERYSEWVCTCLANGSARARFTEAWNLLRPGFTGGSVDRLDEALELMSDAAGTFWRASMHMAILHYVGRYVERDEDVARMYVENACGLADDDVSEMWRRFLVGDGSEESDLPMEPPFELDDIPEWTVLQDMTYTWGHQTLFVRCSNAVGGFENEVFARKGSKVYMPNPIHVSVRSITTLRQQDLFHVRLDALLHGPVGRLLAARLGGAHKLVVLRAHHDGVDGLGAVVVVVGHRDLTLGVGAQIGHLAALAAYLGEDVEQVVGQRERQGDVGVGLVRGVAKHHALVAGALRFGVGALHAAVDVGALLVYGVEHAAALGVEAIFGLGVADASDGASRHLLQVDVCFRFYFSCDDHLPGCHQRFASYFRAGVEGQQLVKHGVRYLIGHLVGVSLGHRFGCKQVTHFQ